MKNSAFLGFLLAIVSIPGTSWTQEKLFLAPPLIKTASQFKALCHKDSTLKLVELRSIMPSVVYDLRYATHNNFTGQPLYPRSTRVCFLRLPAAKSLQLVLHKLASKGLGLKIYDAYRPYSVTVKFWELIKDERYVAHPAKGSGHNRGTAVDLTIIDLRTKRELDMGTGYDDFSEKAHHSYTQLSKEVAENRKLLRTLMTEAGFVIFETEWWHYSLPDATRFDLLDLSFKQLKKTL
jgi:D-alanyl-D-alanine dipeptidase